MKALTRRLPALAALLIAALLALAAATVAVRLIESRSQSEVAMALRADGYDWADVTVDGLQVWVTGIAPSEAARFRALAAASKVVDSARVRDHMRVAEAKREAPTFSIEILRNASEISLIGLVPESMDGAAFLTRMQEIAGEGAVSDLLERTNYPLPTGWDEAVSFGIEAVKALPRSKVSIAAGHVTVKAVADSTTEKRRLETDLAKRIPGDLEVAMDISAPRPAIAPFTLRFLIDVEGHARFDACSADTEEARSRILRAATAAGLEGRSSCQIGLGAPSPRWGEAAALAIGAVKELGGGTVTISDADVSLVALASVDKDLFDTVTGKLENALPDPFSLTAVIPEVIETDGTGEGDGVPEFVATLLDSGSLMMRGRVRDDKQQQVIDAYAKGLFGAKQVQNALRLDEHVPEVWTIRALAALEALKGVSHGRALMRSDFVEIRGTTGNPEAQAELSRLLGDKLGEGANFRIEVTYDKRLDPVLGLPSPEECVAQINEAIAANKIKFAPGSADLDPSADSTLDKIAAIMKNCADFPIEIGGHTDSQGRDEMNQELSQARAESVLNALMSRRVLTGNLTARGYGETKPIADNRTEEGREQNRRIEVRLVGTDEDAAGLEAEADEAGSETGKTETQ